MIARASRIFVLGLVAMCVCWVAHAAELKRVQLSDGTEIEYALVLPAGFESDKTYPAILVFPGGRQTRESVQGALSRYWEDEARKRGYLVFSPVAPPGKLFYESGADLVPEFLERQRAAFRIEGGRFHVAGSSNGAVSAFVVATRYPQLFRSLTALAGFPEEQKDFERLEQLKNMKIAMFVGASDLYWKEGMERTRERLVALGAAVSLTVIPRNGHLLPDLSFRNGARIFERLDP